MLTATFCENKRKTRTSIPKIVSSLPPYPRVVVGACMHEKCHSCRLGGSLGGYIYACMYKNERCHSCRLRGSLRMYQDWTVREAPLDLAKEYKNERCRHPNWKIRGVIGCRLGSGYVTAFGMPCLNACNTIRGDGRRLTSYNVGAE